MKPTIISSKKVQKLAQGPKTLNDYGKVTPISSASPSVIQNLRGMK